MSRLQETSAALAQFATHLDARRPEIMEMWRDAVAADPFLDPASDWSIRQFNDHFPDVLKALGSALRAWPDLPASLSADEQEYAVAHARTRWLQGYSLRGVIREWGHFNAVVVDQIGACSLADPDEAQGVRRVVLGVWARILNDQQTQSALEYHQLEQAEAETRAAELARTLERLSDFSSGRGRALEGIAADMRNDLQLVVTGNSPGDARMQWHEAYELQKLAQDGFRGLERSLADMVTLAQLEAGREVREVAPFDAGQGLALLAEGLQALARQSGAVLRWDGPEHFLVQGDARRVRRLAKHLLFCAMRAPRSTLIEMHWAPDPHERNRWELGIVHRLDADAVTAGTAVGRALAAATGATQEVRGEVTGDQAPRYPAVAEEGVDLLIAKHLCEVLGASLEVDASEWELRYRASLPVAYSGPPRG